MPGTYTSRTGKLYKPAAGDDVNVTTDINNNMDNIDTYGMGFAEILDSSARPTTVWPGLCVFQTSDSTTWVSNGTEPASGSWIQIPNGTSSSAVNLSLAATSTDGITSKISSDTTNRFVMNADGGMEWGSGGVAATDTTLRRSAANTLKTDDSFVAALNVGVGGDLSVGGGVGVLGLLNANTAPTASPTGGIILYSEDEQLKSRNEAGLVQRINGATSLFTETTLQSFTALSEMATVTIPANDAVAGATYRIRVWGTAQANTGTTPSYNFQLYIGGLSGTRLGQSQNITTVTSASNRCWQMEAHVTCLAVGSSGSFHGQMMYMGHLTTAGPGVGNTTPEIRFDGATPATSIDTTGDVDVTAAV